MIFGGFGFSGFSSCDYNQSEIYIRCSQKQNVPDSFRFFRKLVRTKTKQITDKESKHNSIIFFFWALVLYRHQQEWSQLCLILYTLFITLHHHLFQLPISPLTPPERQPIGTGGHEKAYDGFVRIHDTYLREYSIRTDFSVLITWYDTQYVQIFPRKLHETIHCTYAFPGTNYTIRYIVRTEVSKSPRGPVWIIRYIRTLNFCTRTVLVSNSTFCYYKIK